MYIKIWLVAVLLSVVLIPLKAQTFLSDFERGNQLFNLNKFADAIPYYQKELESTNDKQRTEETTFRLAVCYRITGQDEEAEKVYKKLYAKNRQSPLIELNYGLFLKGIGKYKEAQKQFKGYAKQHPEDPRAQLELASCDSAIRWQAQKSTTFVRDVKDWNSEEPEFSPLLWNNTLFFSSSRESAQKIKEANPDKGKEEKPAPRPNKYAKNKKAEPDREALNKPSPTLDIFTSAVADTFIKGPLPKLVQGLGTDFHEGPATINANGDEVFFTRTARQGTKNKAKNLIESNLILVQVKKGADGQWGEPDESFPWNNPAKYSIAHPALSADGNTLIYMSDQPGGSGATDLYICKRNGNTWDPPANLGEVVNTAGYEMFPYIRNDGTLFFASNMHPGMGNLDIFQVKYDSSRGSWGKVTNLKPPINSPYDDFGIAFTEGARKGFFSSKRPGGSGDDDIYSFITNKEMELVYDGDEFRLKNEFFFDQLNYVLTDTASKKDTVLSNTNAEIAFKLSPNRGYILKAMRGKQVVNTARLHCGLSPEGLFNLSFSTDSVPMKLSGYVRSSDASGTAQSMLNAVKGSVGLPGVPVSVSDSRNNLVQQTTTTDAGLFAFAKPFKPKENYSIQLKDQQPVSFKEENTKETPKDTSRKIAQTTKAPEGLVAFKGRAVMVGSGKPITGVKIALFRGTEEVTRVTNDQEGRVYFNLERGETFTVVASKSGYFQSQIKVSTINKPNVTAIEEVLAMELIRQDTSIRLIDIYYDFAKASLRPESRKVLMRMYDFLKEHDSIAVELMSHTDQVGSDAYNMVLSQKRAESVVNFLIDKGISRKRLLAVGYGESTPRVPNAENAKDHQLNRRTEFRVITTTDIPRLLAMHQKRLAEYESTFRKEMEAEARLPAEPTHFTVAPHKGTGKNEGVVPVKYEAGVVFKVQIASSETELPPDYFSGFKRVEMLKDSKGLYKYFGASTADYDKALNSLNKIRNELKIGDAFVVPYMDGKRIEFDEIRGFGNYKPGTPLATTTSQKSEASRGYIVQIAALREKERNANGFKAPNVKEMKGDDEFYRYYVGPFDTWEQAHEEKQKLVEQGYNDAFIRAPQP